MSLRALLWIVLFVFLGALALRGQGLARRDATALLRREEAAYQQVRELISAEYVDPVNTRELFYGALEGMTAKLDQHSAFWDPKKRELERSTTSGHFGGIGVEIRLDRDKRIVIPRLLPNSPAARAGLWPEDQIRGIDGEPTDKMTLDDASQRIRGEPGTKVCLSIARAGRPGLLEVELERAVIKVESVPEALMLKPPESAAARLPADVPRLGYVILARFQEDTLEDLREALAQLEAQGMEGLILDLRQNPGGLLSVAVEVCDMFLSDGLIVSQRERADKQGERPEEAYHARPARDDRTYPLALLLDADSASASEIVAGCFKDNRRAALVGQRTHGKGSVQKLIPLDLDDWGEAVLKITTGRFYSPSGAVINGQGVEPDCAVAFSEEQTGALLGERYRRQLTRDRANGAPGPAPPPRQKLAPGAEAPAKAAELFYDLQLEKAVELLARKLREAPPRQ
jgi:carboxyl-terminal processing protease